MWNPHYVQIASYYINLTGTDPSFLTHAAIEPSHEPNVLDFSILEKAGEQWHWKTSVDR